MTIWSPFRSILGHVQGTRDSNFLPRQLSFHGLHKPLQSGPFSQKRTLISKGGQEVAICRGIKLRHVGGRIHKCSLVAGMRWSGGREGEEWAVGRLSPGCHLLTWNSEKSENSKIQAVCACCCEHNLIAC